MIGPLITGEFLRRPNRFLTICRLNGKETPCYLPNPGPMPDLLFAGVKVLVRYASNSHRKTDYDLVGVHHEGAALSLDSRIPNQLLVKALERGLLPPFIHYNVIKSEPVYRESRLDFLLHGPSGPPCLIEAKSSTDVENGVGLFPRAVTLRGQRHIQELMHAIDDGYRAAIIFLVQRSDARFFRPNDRIDPQFGTALRQAAKYGVEVYAWSSFLDEKSGKISLGSPIPIDLS
ncbi:MAG: DNA/RNA nuclease SfsA [Promethearchaeota archaeon]